MSRSDSKPLDPEGSSGLKRVLDVADRLGRLCESLNDRAEDDGRRGPTVRAESKRAVQAVVADLENGQVPGALGRLHRRHHFDDEQLTIILLLLQRRIQEARQTMSGREVLAFLHDSSWERLRGLRHLAPDGALRRSGLVEIDAASAGREMLDAELRLSERVFRAIERDVTPEIAPRKRKDDGKPRPYRDHREHLLDMARLSRTYQRRARRVFESEEPDETISRSAVKHLDGEIKKLVARIETRLGATPESAGFPLEVTRKRHRLSEEEVLVLVTLLFQEVYAGTSYIEAIELVKMISRSDLDLMSRRRLLTAEGRLVQSGLVRLTQEDGEHQLGGEAHLPAEVVQDLLFGERSDEPIDADTRLDWHEFLEGLEGTDEFFDRLG
jgi:hypothetical protein